MALKRGQRVLSRTAGQMDKSEATAKYDQANRLYEEDRGAEALVLLDELQRSFPSNTNILYSRALCLGRLGRFHEARAVCGLLARVHRDPRAEGLEVRLAGLQPLGSTAQQAARVPAPPGREVTDAAPQDEGEPAEALRAAVPVPAKEEEAEDTIEEPPAVEAADIEMAQAPVEADAAETPEDPRPVETPEGLAGVDTAEAIDEGLAVGPDQEEAQDAAVETEGDSQPSDVAGELAAVLTEAVQGRRPRTAVWGKLSAGAALGVVVAFAAGYLLATRTETMPPVAVQDGPPVRNPASATTSTPASAPPRATPTEDPPSPQSEVAAGKEPGEAPASAVQPAAPSDQATPGAGTAPLPPGAVWEDRKVVFPDDRSMGALYVRDAETLDEWKPLGDTSGALLVPAGKELRLDVYAESVDDLSPLAALDPDAFAELSLQATGATDDALVHVSGLTGLEGLYLGDTAVTDAGMAHLASLTRLQVLVLQRTPITDAGLVHLEGLTALRELSLYGCAITDAGLAHLAGLTNLEGLYLGGGMAVSGSGLAHLVHLTGLKRLNLWETALTDAGLVHLEAFPALEKLNLGLTPITDAGLVHLAGLSTLRELRLGETAITGEGLAHLAGLPVLDTLDLHWNHLTPKGVEQLKGLTGLGTLNLALVEIDTDDETPPMAIEDVFADLERALPNCAFEE